jgi:hypothetical protein
MAVSTFLRLDEIAWTGLTAIFTEIAAFSTLPMIYIAHQQIAQFRA